MPGNGADVEPSKRASLTVDGTLLEVDHLITRLHTPWGTVTPVDNISLRVPVGGSVGLVGESGSGKSMTAFSILRLFPTMAARIESGRVLLAGRDLRSLSDREMREIRGQQVAMIFQDPATYLDPVLTVGEQVAEAWAMHHGWDQAHERVLDALAQVGLPDPAETAKRYPHELSGGMRQRVVIAQATICGPKLLIADEPTTALDVTIQAQILELIQRLRQRLGMALLLITHDLGIVAETCETVAVMYAGQIVEQGPTEQIFSTPGHPYTQGLLSGAISVQQTQTITRAMEGAVPDLRELPSGCRFHPRCPFVMPICRFQSPPMLPCGDDQVAACWLHDPAVMMRKGES
jgi:peptide/nickel transport system ATP-binding protein/oligopeptide transport system ATP-binding protein